MRRTSGTRDKVAQPKRLPQPLLLTRSTFPRSRKLVMPADGILVVVDKPTSWTSFDVVAKTRSIFRTKKIGHAGTLDPMATGVLLLCVGRATKIVESLMTEKKRYLASIELGGHTESYDAETEVLDPKPVPNLSKAALQDATNEFTGFLEQIPPMYSARKVDGKRLYKLARKGITVERKPKRVEVERFEVIDVALPTFSARIDCSKGTYVRSLAHDLGQALGCGGFLTALRREAVGRFEVEEALTIEELTNLEVFRPEEIQQPHWD